MKKRHDLLKNAFGSYLDEGQLYRFSKLTDSLHRLSNRPNVNYFKNSQGSAIPKFEKQPLDILKERLAKGKITIQEFDDIQKRLES